MTEAALRDAHAPLLTACNVDLETLDPRALIAAGPLAAVFGHGDKIVKVTSDAHDAWSQEAVRQLQASGAGPMGVHRVDLVAEIVPPPSDLYQRLGLTERHRVFAVIAERCTPTDDATQDAANRLNVAALERNGWSGDFTAELASAYRDMDWRAGLEATGASNVPRMLDILEALADIGIVGADVHDRNWTINARGELVFVDLGRYAYRRPTPPVLPVASSLAELLGLERGAFAAQYAALGQTAPVARWWQEDHRLQSLLFSRRPSTRLLFAAAAFERCPDVPPCLRELLFSALSEPARALGIALASRQHQMVFPQRGYVRREAERWGFSDLDTFAELETSGWLARLEESGVLNRPIVRDMRREIEAAAAA